MALKRMVLQMGQGTDIRGADSTKAAERAVRDALWRNFLRIAEIATPEGTDSTLLAHAAVVVRMEVPDTIASNAGAGSAAQ